MDLSTTTRTYYKEQPVERPKIAKPGSGHLFKGGEMDMGTSYGQDFLQKQTARRENMKPRNEYMRPSVPIDTITVSKAEYQAHKLGPRRIYKPQDTQVKSDQPFDDRTGYKDTFTEYEIKPRPKPTTEVYAGPVAPLDSVTTVRESYTKHNQGPRRSFKPKQEHVKSDEPFQNSTTMNVDFHAHEVHRRQPHKPEQYQPPTDPMDLNTTNKLIYKSMPVVKPNFHKPSSSDLLKGKGEMSTSTNYEGDFKEKPIDKRKSMKPNDGYKPPNNPIDSVTTHQESYIKQDISRPKVYRPADAPVGSDAPFEERTENRESFMPHEVSPRKMPERRPYVPPTDKLDDVTTVRDSYKGVVQPRRGNFAPDKKPLQSEVPFDSSTTMTTSYQQVEMPER